MLVYQRAYDKTTNVPNHQPMKSMCSFLQLYGIQVPLPANMSVPLSEIKHESWNEVNLILFSTRITNMYIYIYTAIYFVPTRI